MYFNLVQHATFYEGKLKKKAHNREGVSARRGKFAEIELCKFKP